MPPASDPDLPGPSFITPDDLLGGALAEVTDYAAKSMTRAYLGQVCVEASQEIEETCERRLLPFYDLVESDVMTGVSMDGLGGGEPLMGLTAALGLSEARAFGATATCRDIWVSHFPPRRSELWQYTACTITLTWPWGASMTLAPGSFTGPTLDTGHILLNLGVMAPPGTEYTVVYSGGYLLDTPATLKGATRWAAIRRLLLEVEPEQRQGITLDEIDSEILRNLSGYAKT